MERLIVVGGKKLKGQVSVGGAKNVALKALVAACLTDDKVTIENIPLISDFLVMASIIEDLGGSVNLEGHQAVVEARAIKNSTIPLDEAAEVRTSSLFMAPLLARLGRALVPNPGGCRIGARPIDRTILGLKSMGANIAYDSDDGYFHIEAKKLAGTKYKFSKNTHTGTEALILAGVLASGETVLENAAEEPEVDELIELLVSMGAKIKRTENRTIVIDGVKNLHGTTFKIGPDRNEIVTFAVGAFLTEGDIYIPNIKEKQLTHFIDKAKAAGCGVDVNSTGIRFYFKDKIHSTDVVTSFYPGFMTDWQGPWVVLMTKAQGHSHVHETVYENRFSYVQQLLKMGAKIELYNPQVASPEEVYNFNWVDNKPEYFHAAKISGPTPLHNAILTISDLRAGATLVLAALAAHGESIIYGVEHLDRGYEKFDTRLQKLGASIKRISD